MAELCAFILILVTSTLVSLFVPFAATNSTESSPRMTALVFLLGLWAGASRNKRRSTPEGGQPTSRRAKRGDS